MMKPKDRVLRAINALKPKSKESLEAICLTTLKAYLGNLQKNPTETKYRKIPKTSKAFIERVAGFPEAIAILETCAFEETDEAWEVKLAVPDGWLLSEAVKFIDLILGSI